MILEVLDQLNAYLDGRLSLRGLESFVVSNIQRAHDSHDERAIALIDALDVALLQLGSGELDAAGFIRELVAAQRLATTYVVDVGEQGRDRATSSNPTVEMACDARPVRDYHLSVAVG
jgi:hypothetical protein